MSSEANKNQGEGNRDAAREYNEQQRNFVKNEDVEKLAREKMSESEQKAAEKAEEEGRRHARS